MERTEAAPDKIVNLSRAPGDDNYRISMSGDTFVMASDRVKIAKA